VTVFAPKSTTAPSARTSLASIAWGRLAGTKIGVRYFIAAEGIERLLDAALEPKGAKEKK